MSWVDDTRAAWIAWLGGTTPPTDDQATRALTLALATVETWLDRELELIERIQDDAPVHGVIRLRAWPVESLTAITVNGEALELTWVKLDKRTGHLVAPGCYYVSVTTTYTGGFDPMPPDLELALWMVAAQLYPSTLSAAGADMGQTVRRVTTPDVGTVEYSVGAAGETTADELLGGTVSPQVAGLLSRYRAESVVGGA